MRGTRETVLMERTRLMTEAWEEERNSMKWIDSEQPGTGID